MENLTFGLDIATALSVIAAAILFIWNSANSKKSERIQREKEIVQERKERRKIVIQKYVFQIVDNLMDDRAKIATEITNIESILREGQTTQNLNPYRDLILGMSFLFKTRLVPLGKTYGDGRFVKLAEEYNEELNAFLVRLQYLTSGESDETWNFHEVMFAPLTIADTFTARLISEGEDYIDTL